MKEDAKDVATGFECGIGIDNFSDWKEGDIIDAFKMVTKRRTLAMT
jgi:translation initiation factor IF-2